MADKEKKTDLDQKSASGRGDTGQKMNKDGSINIPIEDGDAESSNKESGAASSEEAGTAAEDQNVSGTVKDATSSEDAKKPDEKASSEEGEKDTAEDEGPKADLPAEDEDEEEDDEGAVDGEWKSLDGSGSSADDKNSAAGFFKKKDKKDKKDVQIEELTDRVRRQMAEFDNFRKRTEKEKSQMFEVGARSVIEKILPVVDNFERGLAVADKSDPFVEGMEKTYKQLMNTLESLDVKPIEAVGKTFDPNLHNAVMHVDDDSVGDNVVVEELQKGYTYRGTVVRYSMVKVAN